MKTKIVENETFAVRDGEMVSIRNEQPTSGRWFAIQARTVQMPKGKRQQTRERDGASVEQAAIIACQLNSEGLWQWLYLSHPTKEYIGDMLFDAGASRDEWYYVILEDLRTKGKPQGE